MNKINFLFEAVKSAFYWFLIATATFLFFWPTLILCLLLYPFDPVRKGIHPIISLWAKTLLVICPLMNIRVEGEEYLNHRQTYILISNHQSIADILVALHLSQSFKFIAKKELFMIPILGWSMTLAGYIPLVRGNQRSGKHAALQAKNLIGKGVSVLFFPEGTRSPDGEIHSFKMGAFKLAAEMNVPVVPIVIDGTYHLVPKGQRLFNRNVSVKLKILKPRKLESGDHSSIERILAGTRYEMIETLNQIRSRKEIELTSVS